MPPTTEQQAIIDAARIRLRNLVGRSIMRPDFVALLVHEDKQATMALKVALSRIKAAIVGDGTHLLTEATRDALYRDEYYGPMFMYHLFVTDETKAAAWNTAIESNRYHEMVRDWRSQKDLLPRRVDNVPSIANVTIQQVHEFIAHIGGGTQDPDVPEPPPFDRTRLRQVAEDFRDQIALQTTDTTEVITARTFFRTWIGYTYERLGRDPADLTLTPSPGATATFVRPAARVAQFLIDHLELWMYHSTVQDFIDNINAVNLLQHWTRPLLLTVNRDYTFGPTISGLQQAADMRRWQRASYDSALAYTPPAPSP